MRYVIRTPENLEIVELTKTSYDSWIIPPQLNDLKHIYKYNSKCYGTCSPVEIIDQVISQFLKKEPLIEIITENLLGKLKISILECYHGWNALDLDQGGDGMMVPSFVKIMNHFFTSIKAHDEESEIKSLTDKEFYSKYHWCFDLVLKIKMDQILRQKRAS
jgi:hypothetical protein